MIRTSSETSTERNEHVDLRRPDSLSRRRMLGAAVAGIAAVTAACAPGAPAQAPSQAIRRGRFEGKSVLITGATSGIGRAAALAFASEGARVGFCGRRVALGREVERSIRASGGDAFYVQADVRKPDQVQAFVDAVASRHGRLDIALNNAGISFSKPMHESSLAEWDDLQDTNVRGVFAAMKAEIPHMIQAGGGQILVTASANVAASRPNLGAYNASKRAVAGLVQTAALEYASNGIRVNAICPGATDTPMIRRQAGLEGAPDMVWNTGVEFWGSRNVHGLERVARPEEIASAMLAIASDEMAYMTGSLVFVDGGMTAAL